MAPAQQGRDLSWLAALALSIGLVATIWAVPYLPTNDGPESVFSAHAENHYSDPGTIYSDQLIPTWQYASKGFALVFGPLEPLFGWQNALRITLSLTVLVTAWGYFALVSAIDPRRRALAFLGFPLALSWGFYMGFFAFTMGTGFGLFIVARVLKGRASTGWHWGQIAVLMLLQAVTHVFTAVLTGFVIATVCLFRAPRADRAREVWKLAMAGAPAMVIVVGSAMTPSPGQVAFMGAHFTVLPWHETFTTLPRLIAPGPLGRAVVIEGIVAAAAVFAVFRVTRSTENGGERGLAVAAVALLALGLFAPRDVPGWQLMSPRFLPLGALLALAIVPFEKMRAQHRVVGAAAIFVLAVRSLSMSWSFHRHLAAGCEDVISALAAPVHRLRLQLPVNLDPVCGVVSDPLESDVPYLSPLRHIGALFAVAHGGSTPYLFAGSAAAQAFLVRVGGIDLPPIPSLADSWGLAEQAAFRTNDAYRHEALDELATAGMSYEAVDVTGARADDLNLWRARGYVPDWERGSVLLAHFEACHLDVTVPRASGLPAPLFDIGVGLRLVVSGLRPVARPDGDFVHFDIPRSPCGNLWVRPRWADPRQTCTNAGSDGNIHLVVTRGAVAVSCVRVGERVPLPRVLDEGPPIVDVSPAYVRALHADE